MDFWRIVPGRLEDALSLYLDVRRLHGQLGAGEQRLWRGVIAGEQTGRLHSTVRFNSMAALGEFGLRWSAGSESAATSERFDAPDSPMTCTCSIAMREMAGWGADINDRGSAALVRTFEVLPDRGAEFLDIVETTAQHALRYGAIVRLYQVTVGGRLVGSMVTEAVFPDMSALGNYFHEYESDPELRSAVARILGPETPARLLTTSIDHEVLGEDS